MIEQRLPGVDPRHQEKAANDIDHCRGREITCRPVANKAIRSSIIQIYGRKGVMVVVLLLASMALFVLGIFRPFTSVTKLWLFENQLSVWDGLVILWNAGEMFLFLILFVFTITFPFIKLSAMLALWLWPRLSREQIQYLFHFVSHMGKWSMLDVFVVAILVLTVKSGGLASIHVRDGFFMFFLSVMLTQAASFWTGQVIAKRLQ
jgi:paraquat-inducible protein A